VLLEYGTLAWCAVEASVSIWIGVAAGSIALIAFGLDSGIEIFAALVVLWQLRVNNEERTRRAMRLIAITFFLLAAYVMVESIHDLVFRVQAKPSLAGVGFTAIALVVMSLLAVGKWSVGKQLSNAVLLADAKESMLCTLFSVTTLLGLALNATLGWWWADPAAGIVIAVLAVEEGREAWLADRQSAPSYWRD
jgi:divalent metal cation (Fe/Co/Zn/Cd) transporter